MAESPFDRLRNRGDEAPLAGSVEAPEWSLNWEGFEAFVQ